jgi:hypothetical protein
MSSISELPQEKIHCHAHAIEKEVVRHQKSVHQAPLKDSAP